MPTYQVSNGSETYEVESPTELSGEDVLKAVGMHGQKSIDLAQQAGGGFGKLREAEARPPIANPSRAERFMSGFAGMGVGPESTETSPVYGEEQRQAQAKGSKEAFKEIAPYAAGALAAEAVPVPAAASIAVGGFRGLAALLARSAIRGGVGFASQEAAKEAEEGKLNPTKIGAYGVGGAIAGPLTEAGGAKLAGAALGAVRSAQEASGNRVWAGAKGAIGGLLKPIIEPPESAARRIARQYIEDKWGIEIPTSPGEAVGKYVQELKKPVEGSINPTELDGTRQAVLYAATKIAPPGASPAEIAHATRQFLQSNLAPIDSNANKAIDDFSQQISDALAHSEAATVQQGQGLIGQGVDTHTAGQSVKGLAENGIERTKQQGDALYDTVRAHPFYPGVKAVPSTVSRWADEMEGKSLVQTKNETSGLVGPFGEALETQKTAPLPKTLGDISGTLAQVKQFASTPQSLENLRRWRSLLFKQVNDPAGMPGIPQADKWALYDAVTQDINKAVADLPTGTLKRQLTQANTFYRDTADAIRDPFIQSLSKDVGVAKGAEPGTIIGQLTGVDAQSKFDRLKQVLGPDYPKAQDAVRQALTQQIHESAYNPVDGTYNLGDAVNKLAKFKANAPQEFGAMFPNYDAIVGSAQRQAAVRAAKGIKPDDALRAMAVNPAEITALLEPTKAPAVVASAQAAMRANAVRDAAKANQIYADVMGGNLASVERDPQALVNKIIGGDFKIQPGKPGGSGTGGYSADLVKQMMSAVGSQDPELSKRLQETFMESLLNDARKPTKVGGNVIDPETLLDLLSDKRRGAVANAMLGSQKVKDLTEAAAALRDTGPTKGESVLSMLGSDGIQPQEIVRVPEVARQSFLRANLSLPRVKLYLASKILNDNSLRKIAATPISKLTEPQTKALATALSASP